MKLKCLLLLFVPLSFSLPSTAQTTAPFKPVRLLLSGALEFGGDEVAKVFFNNGEDQAVNAGQGGTISVGAQFEFRQTRKFVLRTSIGYKYLTTAADNVHIRLTRVPLQFTANFLPTEKFRLGAGLATHTGIKFNSGGLGENMSFKSNVGPVIEFAYNGMGLSFTALRYKDQYNTSYAANAFGFTFSGVIPGNRRG